MAASWSWMEQGPTTAIRRSSRPCSTAPMACRLRSTSVSIAGVTGRSSSSTAGETSARTAAMRTSSMRVVSSVPCCRGSSSMAGMGMGLVLGPGLGPGLVGLGFRCR
jgi:hypothetical protein